MKNYIKLPKFTGDEPLTELKFNPVIEDYLSKPQNEKQYEINLYINSHKMLNNLIYSKVPLNKDGTIPIQNIINVKKLYKENKSEDEEELMPEMQKEKSAPAPPANAGDDIELIVPKKRFISISEYPGNYYKPEKEIINERQVRYEQNNKINIFNSGIDGTGQKMQSYRDINNKNMNIKFNHEQLKDSFQALEQENKSLKSQVQAQRIRRKSIEMQIEEESNQRNLQEMKDRIQKYKNDLRKKKKKLKRKKKEKLL